MAEISRRIQTAYEWDSMADPVRRGYSPPVDRTEVEVSVEILETYVGEYQLRPDFSLVVTLEDGALFAEPYSKSSGRRGSVDYGHRSRTVCDRGAEICRR